MKKLYTHIQVETGAELPEWIAMIAVVLILLLAITPVFSSGGNQIGSEITAAVQDWVGDWTDGGASGGPLAAEPAGQAPTNGGGSQAINNLAPQGGDPQVATNNNEGGNLLHQIGGFFHGLVVDGAIGTVTSLFSLGGDLLVMLPGTGHIADWFAPGIRDQTFDKYSQMWEIIKANPSGALYAIVEPMVTAWQNGEYGQAIGMGVFEGLMFVVPGDEVGKLAKLDKVLPDELLTALARIEKATPDELIALLRRADQLTPDEIAAIRRRLDDLSPEALARAGMDETILRRLGLACSFSADTLVATPLGVKTIAMLSTGDTVLAYHEEQQSVDYYPIAAVLIHEDPVIVRLVIDQETLVTTPEHPFFVQDRGWQPASALQIGDAIVSAKTQSGVIQQIVFVNQPQQMYNLHVEEAHTFFVGRGQWLVHNTCLRDPKTIRFTQDSIKAEFKTGDSVDNLIQKLKSGELTADQIPPIRIFEKNGKIYSLDNRRLYTFQEANVPLRTVWATPEEVAAEAWKFTTKNDGTSIRVREGQ